MYINYVYTVMVKLHRGSTIIYIDLSTGLNTVNYKTLAPYTYESYMVHELSNSTHAIVSVFKTCIL